LNCTGFRWHEDSAVLAQPQTSRPLPVVWVANVAKVPVWRVSHRVDRRWIIVFPEDAWLAGLYGVVGGPNLCPA
jgi:hypothetical protein